MDKNVIVPTCYKKCTNIYEIFADGVGGGPGLTTWFLEGVGQMTMFDHDGGRGSQNFRKSDHVVFGCPLSAFMDVSNFSIKNRSKIRYINENFFRIFNLCAENIHKNGVICHNSNQLVSEFLKICHFELYGF